MPSGATRGFDIAPPLLGRSGLTAVLKTSSDGEQTDLTEVTQMRVPLLIITLLAHAMIVHVAGPDAFAQTNPPQAQSGPQDRRSTGADARPGETLSERLDRTDGVIRPPSSIAPQMPQARPPAPDPVLRPSYRRRVPRGETNRSSPSRLDSDKGDPFLSDVARNLYRAPGCICHCRSLCDFLAQLWSS